MLDKEKDKTNKEEEKIDPLMDEEDEEEEEEEEGETSPLMKKLKPFLIPLGVSIIVGYLMVTFAGVPRNEFRGVVGSTEWEVGEIGGKVTAVEDLVKVVNDRLASVEVKAGNNTNLLVNTISQSELNALSGEVNDVKVALAGLDISSQNELADIINTKFAEYAVIITDYEARIAEMEVLIEDMEALIESLVEEKEAEEDDDEITSDITRWSLSAYATNNTDVMIGYVASPYRIEDGGDYTVTLTILNPTSLAISNLTLEVALRPTSGDIVFVDENEIYLDTTQYPYSLWDCSVVKKSDESCRRIVFNCAGVTAVAGTGEGEDFVQGTTVMRLELTLAYK